MKKKEKEKKFEESLLHNFTARRFGSCGSKLEPKFYEYEVKIYTECVRIFSNETTFIFTYGY